METLLITLNNTALKTTVDLLDEVRFSYAVLNLSMTNSWFSAF